VTFIIKNADFSSVNLGKIPYWRVVVENSDDNALYVGPKTVGAGESLFFKIVNLLAEHTVSVEAFTNGERIQITEINNTASELYYQTAPVAGEIIIKIVAVEA
jgi:hypothetical protein